MQMCISKPSGMKLVFIKRVKELNDNQMPATPAKIAQEYNMTYRHILRLAFELSEEGFIERIIEDWKVRYVVTNEGSRLLY